MIRMVVPLSIDVVGFIPAGISPTTLSDTGAWRLAVRTSSARTAYPSMLEFAKGGRSIAEEIVWASTRPATSSDEIHSGGSVLKSSKTRVKASATDNIEIFLES
jgi:hypothetical protein